MAAPLAAGSSGGIPESQREVVARTHLRGSGLTGSVFFLRADGPAGRVAVGASHSFDRTLLAESAQVVFRSAEGRELARASRYHVRPGPAYHEPGATLRDDFVVFQLEEPTGDDPPSGLPAAGDPPSGLPAGGDPPLGLPAGGDPPSGLPAGDPPLAEPPSLEAGPLPEPGDRLFLLGLPSQGPPDLRRLPVEVVRVSETRIEADLAGWVDLRGFGGSALIDEDGRAVGLLQSAWPAEGRLRLGVGPISGVVDSLRHPLDAGMGRLFVSYAPPPSAATDQARRRRLATGSAHGDLAGRENVSRRVERAVRELPPSPPPGTTQPPEPASVELVIEHPASGAVFGDAAGAFLAGRAVSAGNREGPVRFDVMLVVDTSDSTNAPTGVDIDGDGLVGEPEGRRGGSSDPGDSILAAEVAAARRLVASLDPRITRVGLVTFAGEARPVAPFQTEWVRSARTEEPLTSDFGRVQDVLAQVLARGAYGGTHMAAGLDQATLELLGISGSLSHADPESRKVVLFFTDGEPTLPATDEPSSAVRSALRAAHRARRAGVRVHSFAIGPEALGRPIAPVEMAALTGGIFVPVRDSGELASLVELVSFARIDEVTVTNRSDGGRTRRAMVQADGSWDALVRLVEGENRIEVAARSDDATLATREIVLRQEPGAQGPDVPLEFLGRRGLQLERVLAEAERERVERMRKELVLEMERERAAAVERAERQRKELELEVQPLEP